MLKVNCLKTIPFKAAYTYTAHLWQYPLPPRSRDNDVIIRLLIDASEFVHNDSNINYVRNLAKESFST